MTKEGLEGKKRIIDNVDDVASIKEKSVEEDEQRQETKTDPGSSKDSKPFAKSQAVIAIIVGIVTVLSFVLELPKKLGFISDKKEPVQVLDSLLVSGIVRQKDNKTGISNAWVTADLLGRDTLSTTSDGTFEFFVKGKSGQSIRVYVGAEGYEQRNEFHVLPKAISIDLEPK